MDSKYNENFCIFWNWEFNRIAEEWLKTGIKSKIKNKVNTNKMRGTE